MKPLAKKILKYKELKVNCLIKERKKESINKPKHYLWDLDKNAFISSIYPTGVKDIYTMDLKAYGINAYLLIKIGNKPLIELINHTTSLKSIFNLETSLNV